MEFSCPATEGGGPNFYSSTMHPEFAWALASFRTRTLAAVTAMALGASLADALLLGLLRGGVLLLQAGSLTVPGLGWVFEKDLATGISWACLLAAALALRFLLVWQREARTVAHYLDFEAEVRRWVIRADGVPPGGGSGAGAHRFTHDFAWLQRGASLLHLFLHALIQLAIFLPFLVWLSWELALAMILVLAPLTALVQRRLHRVGAPLAQLLSRRDRLGVAFQDWLQLRASWTLPEGLLVAREGLLEEVEEHRKIAAWVERKRSLLLGVAELVSGLVTVLVLALSGMLMASGRMTPADLVSFCAALLLCYRPLREAFRLPPALRDSQEAWRRLRALGEAPARVLPVATDGSQIELAELTFGYGSHAVIDGVTLSLPTDQPLLLQGPNGSGKSTLLRLMAGLLSPQSGELRLPRALLQEEVAFLDQEPLVPSRLHIQPKDAEELHLVREVLRVESGPASAGGPGLLERHLSGGELQRRALAAVLLEPARLVLLDEPVAHLPSGERARVLQELRAFCVARGRTLVIASHEPSPGYRVVELPLR